MNILKPIVLSVAASIPFLSSGVVTDELTYNWGPADTVAHHKVGPGMTYAKIVFPEKPLILWWVEVDLSNEYAKIEQSESRASVPGFLSCIFIAYLSPSFRFGTAFRSHPCLVPLMYS